MEKKSTRQVLTKYVVLSVMLFVATKGFAVPSEVRPPPAASPRCEPPLANLVSAADGALSLKYDDKEFEAKYKDLAKYNESIGQPTPSREEVKAQVHGITFKKLSEAFPQGAPEGSARWSVTIKCRFYPRFGCEVIIQL